MCVCVCVYNKNIITSHHDNVTTSTDIANITLSVVTKFFNIFSKNMKLYLLFIFNGNGYIIISFWYLCYMIFFVMERLHSPDVA